ncbi:FliG C-terminal domain-containing protein [Vibrio barjaei]|uniref:FliG C-terminal domain-containing protein n=1 Tax=Vibrio barjaei TaxID=1676683 RepID=UPI002284FA9E|nr:FliG C-terminal domain-containing protein [Vibrio barjaei]MCY9872306.1 flagellar motor switch protein FliG [Vibrio barjaei]
MVKQLDSEADFKKDVNAVALLIMMMGPELGAKVLQKFDYEQVGQITKAMSKFEDVRIPEASRSIRAFFKDFSGHSGIIKGDRAFITQMLDNTLETGMAKELVSSIYGDDIGEKAKDLEWVPDDFLVSKLQVEHIELQALLLAHLDPKHASRILNYYEEDVSLDLMYRISRKDVVTTGQVDTVLELVEKCKSEYMQTRSKTINGIKATADILNRFQGNKSKFFDYVKSKDVEASEAIEESMIDFTTIFRQSMDVLDLINDKVSSQLWAAALKGADEEQKEYVLSSMPSRLATELRDNMSALGAVPMSTVETARSDILKIVRQMNNEGVISLSFTSESMVS